MSESRTNPHAGAGARIRDARRALDWTQEDLARNIGVSRSAVAQWETDRSGQVRGNLTRIARALEVSVEYLVTGQDNATPSDAHTGDELALLRLYRECSSDDRRMLLLTARRLARTPP